MCGDLCLLIKQSMLNVIIHDLGNRKERQCKVTGESGAQVGEIRESIKII